LLRPRGGPFRNCGQRLAQVSTDKQANSIEGSYSTYINLLGRSLRDRWQLGHGVLGVYMEEVVKKKRGKKESYRK